MNDRMINCRMSDFLFMLYMSWIMGTATGAAAMLLVVVI